MNHKDRAVLERFKSGLWTADPATGKVLTTRTLGGLPLAAPKPIGCQAKHTKHNYMVTGIKIGGKRYQMRLHRAIWLFVHGFIPDGMDLDHINGDRTDNRIANLRLVTPKENKANAIRLGTSASRERNGQAKLTAAQAVEIKALLAQGTKTQPQIAAMFGVSRQAVSSIKNGRTWV